MSGPGALSLPQDPSCNGLASGSASVGRGSDRPEIEEHRGFCNLLTIKGVKGQGVYPRGVLYRYQNKWVAAKWFCIVMKTNGKHFVLCEACCAAEFVCLAEWRRNVGRWRPGRRGQTALSGR